MYLEYFRNYNEASFSVPVSCQQSISKVLEISISKTLGLKVLDVGTFLYGLKLFNLCDLPARNS